MTPSAADRRLNALLADLCAILSARGEGTVALSSSDLALADAGVVDEFVKTGLLERADPARSTICDGCERACPMPVQFEGGGQHPLFFIVCDKRDDIGRVPVAPGSLERWGASLAKFAQVAARLLQTDRPARLTASGAGAMSSG